jgi:hypothetical protein
MVVVQGGYEDSAASLAMPALGRRLQKHLIQLLLM